jgi:hypothetical protein
MTPLNERATLTYLKWDKLYEAEKPFQIFVDLPEGVDDPRTDNLIFESETEQDILDVRGREESFNLNDHGFQFVRHKTSVDIFDSKEKIENIYLAEMTDLLEKTLQGADRVVFFNWRVCS